MTIQFTLILSSLLLLLLLGLIIWLIRIILNRNRLLESQKINLPTVPNQQHAFYNNRHKAKYAKSKLPMAEKERCLKKIIAAMEVEKVYRKADLNITELALQLEIPKHHLSQIINEQLDTGFIDFVNRYRIEEAKEKLQDTRLQTVSNMAIGEQGGFKAKSTFYSVFKKYTNQTPAAFRRTKTLMSE